MANESFANIRAVKSFNGEVLESRRFGAFVQSSLDSGLAIGRAKGLLEGVSEGASQRRIRNPFVSATRPPPGSAGGRVKSFRSDQCPLRRLTGVPSTCRCWPSTHGEATW